MDKTKAQHILNQLTTEEKVMLQVGMDNWHTMPIDRVGLPSIMVCDGPHGLRKQLNSGDHLGMGYSIPAVCFPAISKLACSWDREVMSQVGNALAQQCLAEDVSVLLAPGINIKRNSLCGRNFEYFSEDPYLAGELATRYVTGVQENGVGVSLKHFAANNQEYARLINDSIIDDRALHEIYLRAFAKVITTANPYTVMCSYNKINGVLVSQNPYMLTTLLRNEWGFQGVAVSDWGAVSNRPAGITAGLDLQMPHDDYHTVSAALADGTLDEKDLDRSVLRIIELVLRTANMPRKHIDHKDQHKTARSVARQCTVLAKNTCSMLPLSTSEKIAVIGAFAKTPHYQGGGSSDVNSTQVTGLLDALDKLGIDYSYSAGYSLESTQPDPALISHAVDTATGADKVILLVGLPDTCEYESFDRQTLDMPDSINSLISAVTAVNGNTIAVVQSGSPIDMRWEDSVKAVILDYMPGQAGGLALADILYAKVTPSGRLAETWPISHTVQSSRDNFGNDAHTTIYTESIFVGYRYYDKVPQYIKYPFGYGLSYTTFDYSDISVDKTTLSANDKLTLSVTITNTGKYDGAEVVQVYASSLDNRLPMPDKQLVAFDKVFIPAGEKTTVKLDIDTQQLAYYNTASSSMVVDGGRYQIHIAKDTQHILYSIDIVVEGENTSMDISNTCPCYYNITTDWQVPMQQFESLYAKPIPVHTSPKRGLHTVDSTFSEIRNCLAGRIIYRLALKASVKNVFDEKDLIMITRSLPNEPLRSMAMTSNMSRGVVEGVVDIVNGKIISGASKALRYLKINKKRKQEMNK